MFDSDGSLWEHLDDYAELFTDCFRRRDQARWVLHYLQGLLAPVSRKNVENLAREISTAPTVADPVQALQNFINQSPWDERKLWRRFRTVVAPALNPAEGVLAIHDVGFLKQGQHSIGVQRQFWNRLGKKANCQLAVAISHVGPGGVCPLALRLYLPKSWASDEHRLALAGVPAQFRGFRSRSAIALDLLDELRADKIAVRTIVAGASYGAAPEFRRELAARGWSFLGGVPDDFPVYAESATAGAPGRTAEVPAAMLLRHRGPGQSAHRDWLRVRPHLAWNGEGRTEEPLGLYLERQQGEDVACAVGNLPADLSVDAVAALWNHLHKAEDLQERLSEDLGLTHFEGRSWRGFHHHTCLVMLAYGFLLREGLQRPPALEHAFAGL